MSINIRSSSSNNSSSGRNSSSSSSRGSSRLIVAVEVVDISSSISIITIYHRYRILTIDVEQQQTPEPQHKADPQMATTASTKPQIASNDCMATILA